MGDKVRRICKKQGDDDQIQSYKGMFLGEFSPLGDPKKRGSANPTKDSFGKEVSKSPYFDGEKTEIAISRQQVLVCHQQIAGILKFLVSSLSHVSQISCGRSWHGIIDPKFS